MRTLFVTSLVTVVLAAAQGSAPAAAHPAPPEMSIVSASFQAYSPDATAVTYRADLVPSGARVSVVSLPIATSTTVLLGTSGLVPHREYGAHVHVRGCGQDPADAGPHYQNRPDPNQPSTDPSYANPDNEIWLDFTTDAFGNGFVSATVDWVFRDRGPRAVVLHENHTHTGPGDAGTAGARLACVTVGG